MALLETALAFAIAMLAASLFVSAAVQLLQRIGKYRANGLRELLQSLIAGFRTYHNDTDADTKAITDPLDARFIKDILSDPLFFSRGEGLDQSANLDDQTMLDELSADDLVGIVYNYARSAPPGNNRQLEAPSIAAAHEPTTILEIDPRRASADRAVVAVAPADVPLPIAWFGAGKTYATTSNFAAYTARWFRRLELNATQRFRTRAFRLTTVVAATVVILFCLDGVQLIGDLYRNNNGRASLVSQQSSVEATAARLAATTPAPSSAATPADTDRQLLGEMGKLATILDQANVGIGWQSSRIVERWCAFRGRCEDALPPSASSIVFETFLWVTGMLFSFAMLMLGAPFWYRVVTSLTTAASSKGDKAGSAPQQTPPEPVPPAQPPRLQPHSPPLRLESQPPRPETQPTQPQPAKV